MKLRFTYCLLIVFLALNAGDGIAQSCEQNMLVIPDASSYAVIPNPKNILLPGAFSIEFWAQSSSFSAHSGLIEELNNGDTGAFSIRFSSGSSLDISLRLNNGVTNMTTPNIQNIQNWQHYALTFTPNDSIRIYINSVLIASQKTSANNLVVSSDSILIAHSDLSGVTFTGNIDELRFWNTARTSAQIFASMNTALTGNETGLKAYISFDDDPASQTIHDFSGGKSEGVLLSSASLGTSTSPVTGTSNGYMLASEELSVIFPDLLCGSSADTIIHIYNRGSESVQINPVAFQSGTTFSASTTGFPLPPDSTHLGTIQIHAAPANPGLFRDTLIVQSTTICGGTLRIPVELRFQKIAIAFPDSLFSLGFGSRDLLPCDLPDTAETSLKNTGTKSATITSLQFSFPAAITIVSPKPPFTIAPGVTQIIKFAVLSGIPGPINTTLIARTAECSQTASMKFQGNRIVPKFSVPDQIIFPNIHLPAAGTIIDTTIYLKNTGTATLLFNPPIKLEGGSGFKLLSPQFGSASLPLDSILAIRISYKPYDCGLFQTYIHLQDQSNCHIDTLIPVTINVLGPEVAGISSLYDLGASCGSHDTTITLINKSGRSVIIGKPTFSKDSVISVIFGSLPKTLDPGDSVSIRIHFSPPEPGSYSVDARFALSPCGETDIHFDGILGVGKIVLSDPTLDFGNGCDLTTSTQKLTITNNCGRQISITGSTFNGSQNFSIINPVLPFTLVNNESKEITIQFSPQQLPLSDNATIILDDSGCFVTRFQAHGVREIANVAWNPSIGAEFGTVCPGNTVTSLVDLRNLGFGDDSIISTNVLIDTSLFHSSFTTGPIIQHGSLKEFTVSFSPKDTGSFWDYLQVILAPCGDTTRIALHGIGGPAPILLASDSILDFPVIKAGSSDSLCIVFTNPSCIPIPISIDSIHSPASVFTLSQNSKSILPDSVNSSDPLQLCFVFAPDKTGTFETTDTIYSGNQRKLIVLQGTAGISDLKFNQKFIDFGDVLKDSVKKKILNIHNNGNLPAILATVTKPVPDFSHTTDGQTIGATSSDTIEFNPKHLGVQADTMVYRWENHFDSLFLRGRGIQPGLSFQSSLIDFSKVRIAHDSVISVSVTNTLDTNISITTDSITGKFSVSPTGAKILFPQETQSYNITYLPDAEQLDTGSLYLVTSYSGIAILPLRGEGVEAHFSVDSSNIHFGDVGLQQTGFHTLKIINTGAYPLAITNIGKNLSVFDTSLAGIFLIPPDSSADYILNFTPQRATQYYDTLKIDADAPEKSALISLTGKGVFSPLGVPEVTYNIPDYRVKVGDIVDIPIGIAGKDLSLFNIDSFHVNLSYDPTLIYFFDSIKTTGTIAAGFTVRFDSLAHDSIISISGMGSEIVASPGVFFILRAMALLGPNDSTRISIQSSDPVNTGDLLSSSGSFVITDCENYRGGILFEGNYSVSQVNPNPVSNSAHIDYEIGLPGRVHLDLYDALGRHIKTIVDDDEIKGKHSVIFSAEDIPSGEYIYDFKSLEFETRGAMIIAK